MSATCDGVSPIRPPDLVTSPSVALSINPWPRVASASLFHYADCAASRFRTSSSSSIIGGGGLAFPSLGRCVLQSLTSFLFLNGPGSKERNPKSEANPRTDGIRQTQETWRDSLRSFLLGTLLPPISPDLFDFLLVLRIERVKGNYAIRYFLFILLPGNMV